MCPPYRPWYRGSTAAFLVHLMLTDEELGQRLEQLHTEREDQMDWKDWVGA